MPVLLIPYIKHQKLILFAVNHPFLFVCLLVCFFVFLFFCFCFFFLCAYGRISWTKEDTSRRVWGSGHFDLEQSPCASRVRPVRQGRQGNPSSTTSRKTKPAIRCGKKRVLVLITSFLCKCQHGSVKYTITLLRAHLIVPYANARTRARARARARTHTHTHTHTGSRSLPYALHTRLYIQTA